MSASHEAYYAFVKQNVSALVTSYNNLKGRGQFQWNALDYGNTLPAPESGEFVAADAGAAVFGTMDAIEALMNAGHATNLSKLLDR